MNEKHDGTRMIHGECRLEATSPWADDVILNGLRLQLDLHIVPRRGRVPADSGATAALRRASASVRALCFESSRYQQHALMAGIGVLALALALAFWSAREPSGVNAPTSERPTAPVVAKSPEPRSPPRPVVPLAPAAKVTPLHAEPSPPPGTGSPATESPSLPAPNEAPSARKLAAPSRPTPPPLAAPPAPAVKSFATAPSRTRAPANDPARAPGAPAPRDVVGSVAAPPVPSAPPVRSSGDMLDLFGDTK